METVMDSTTTVSPPAINDSATLLNDTQNCTDIENEADAFVDNLYKFVANTIFVGLFCLVGLLGNTISFIILRRSPLNSTGSVTIRLLSALAIADNAFLIASLFFQTFDGIPGYWGVFIEYWQAWPYMINFILGFGYTAQTCSIWFTVFMTLDRYIAVCLPHRRSQVLSSGKINKIILLISGLALLYNIPRFLEFNIIYVTQCNGVVVAGLEASTLQQSVIYRFMYTVTLYWLCIFLIPFGVLVFANAKLILALRTQAKKRVEMGKIQNKSETENLTKVLIVVVVVFLICNIPAAVNQGLIAAGDLLPDNVAIGHFYYSVVADALASLNSSVNFIIYCILSPSFRKTLKKTICGSCSDSHINSIDMCQSNSVSKYTLSTVTSSSLENLNCTPPSGKYIVRVRDVELGTSE